ncbi:hypothetical protein NC974_26765 [Leptolyngbya sp. SLC-A1]|uniref:glycosyltransferase n=1 Tax=unclassified Leptolyngbya TaxID=2650499 RepID=UPI00329864E8
MNTIVVILIEVSAAIYFCYCLIHFDVFIFGFGRTFLRKNADLPFLRLFRKKIIVNMAHGSELRPPYIDGSFQSLDGLKQPTVNQLKYIAYSHKKKIIKFEKYADYIIGAPFSSTHFACKKLINWFAIGVPYCEKQGFSTTKYQEGFASSTSNISNSIRILHSPSHPAVKGSSFIRQSIQSLQYRGYDIEFVEIQGRSNQEVLKELQKCDFVVDQLYSDTPMAGFATEAAWFGKPSVVGGYGFGYLQKFIPTGMLPPSKICYPKQIEAAIEELILNQKLRLQLGAEAQAFVRNYWSAEKVAERYLRLISGNIPDDWWLDPNEVIYLHGCGQSELQSAENIRRMVKTYGHKSLRLSHRPDLEKAFLEFAGLEST